MTEKILCHEFRFYLKMILCQCMRSNEPLPKRSFVVNSDFFLKWFYVSASGAMNPYRKDPLSLIAMQ